MSDPATKFTAVDGPAGSALFRLLAAGVAAWLLAAVGITLWFFAITPDPGLMGVAFPFYAWMIAYVPGGVIMLLYGAWRVFRGPVSARVLAWAGAVYFLPLILQTAVMQALLHLAPTTIQYGDEPMMLAAFTGPVFFILFLVGLARGYARRERPLRQTGLAILIPPLIGVALSFAGAIVFALTSSQWQHRDDFALRLERIEWRDPQGLFVEARLEVKKDAAAGFHAFYEDRRGDTGRGEPVAEIEFGAISGREANWYQKEQTLKAGETYRVRLAWPRLATTSLNSERRIIFRLTDGPYAMSRSQLKEFRIAVDPDAATLAALEGKLVPMARGARMGYENKAGKVIIEPNFDWADEFHEGLAVVRVGQRWGYIDQRGATAIPLQYANATRFSEGLAAVAAPSNEEYKMGYIDKTGRYVIAPHFHAAHPFSDGLARVRMDGKEGYIDKTGSLVIAPQWEWAHDFAEGRAAVQVGDKWGFIDRAGKIVVAPRFNALRPHFHNGRAEVMLGNEWGTVDLEGRWISDAEKR